METFRVISDFPMYAVSNHGRIMNVHRNTEMVLSHNAYGEVTVGLWRDGKQHRRAVKGIVARTFVEGETEEFNTPMFLDNDRDNLNADNIVWRPRWFALMYMRQFQQDESWWYVGPVGIVESPTSYENIIEAAIGTGSLAIDIRGSLMDHIRVFPGGQRFVFV